MKKSKHCKDCSGCNHCIYIGDGDFVCDKHIHEPEKAVVIEDWSPTDNHLQCQRKAGKCDGKC